ncbi:HAD domain-containing protein [Vibrio owensii]|uniref:HAD domain-containing protein n=1 Tax=Vibrio owensii TaxID=696485 RepID=UPI0018F17202|nr:HAD domain-containing protein [Vibrio owensii]
MKQFDIYLVNSKFKAVKSNKPFRGEFITQLSAPSASAALARFRTLQSNGKLNVEELTNASRKAKLDENRKEAGFATTEEHEPKLAIYCDVNGVLDDREKNASCREWNPSFRLPQIIDVDRLFEVVKLAVKHNALLVMISEWRKQDVVFYTVISRALRRSENEIHKEFLDTHRRKIRDLCCDSTPTLKDRDTEIRKHIEWNNITNCVVFEDEHPITEPLNPIMIYGPGLTQEHIDRADLILSAA